MFEFLRELFKGFFESVVQPTLGASKHPYKGELNRPTTADSGIGSVAVGGIPVMSVGAPHVTVIPPPVLAQDTAAIVTKVTSPIISVINKSTVLSDAEIKLALAALQIQLDRDFAPVWGLTASLQFLPATTPLPIHHWSVFIMDTSDQQGALGYHDLASTGLPIGKIFAKDDQKYGLSWTVTLSHEVLEMLADPWIANCSFAQDSNTTGVLYAMEVCDPCEADNLGYMINNVRVSSFIYPAWFEGFRKPNSTKFDFSGKITQPFQLAPGGYISKFTVGPSGGSGWTQATAEGVPSARLNAKLANISSRPARRADLTETRLSVLGS